MKKITPMVVVLLLLAGGYFIFVNGNQENGTMVSKSGEIVEVELDQMAFDGPGIITMLDSDGALATIAVPSMGIQLCPAYAQVADIQTAAIGDKMQVSGELDEEGRIVPCASEDHYLRITGFMGDAVYGYEFAYRKGPDGYTTLEDNESTDEDYVTGVTLLNAREYAALLGATDAREGPPAMHLRVYRNDDKLQASVWVLRHPLESNVELAMSEPEEAVISGANAVFYTVDGLYPTDTYVAAHGDHMYVLMGSYLDTEDAIHDDFQNLVSSFTFTPLSYDAPQGKIDPRVVCEGALAYMTFASGAEADAFVESCVAGEHPEVIDRYINDRGLDGAAI